MDHNKQPEAPANLYQGISISIPHRTAYWIAMGQPGYYYE